MVQPFGHVQQFQTAVDLREASLFLFFPFMSIPSMSYVTLYHPMGRALDKATGSNIHILWLYLVSEGYCTVEERILG